MAKETSAARIEANRKNAQRSTGPKTAQGKAVVKWNAQKHGLLAREVVISSGEGKESQAEFDQLLGALVSELEPVGILEEFQVEKIAVCYWRLKRVLRCEAGEIRKGIVGIAPIQTETIKSEVTWALTVANYCHTPAEAQLLKNGSGLSSLYHLVVKCRQEIEQSGALGEESLSNLLVAFGTGQGDLGLELRMYNFCAKGEYPEPFTNRPRSFDEILEEIDTRQEESELSDKEPPYTPVEAKKKLLEILAEKQAAYAQAFELFQQAEAKRREATLASLTIPGGEIAASIQRYETTIDRQLSRAMNELRELQRARRGATPRLSPSNLTEQD